MRPLRIAQVLHGWPPASMGGTGLYVEALSLALQAEGHRLRLLAPLSRPGQEEVAAGGLKGLRVGGLPALRWSHNWHPAGLDARVGRWLEDEAPDVVHIHHLSGLGFPLIAQARAAGARVILSLHDYHLVCARGQLVDAAGKICPGPSAAACPDCAAGRAPQQGLRQRLGQGLQRLGLTPEQGHRARSARIGMGLAHRRLSPSQDLADRMQALGMPAIETCPLPLLRPIAPAPVAPPGPLRILFASAMLPTKGPDRLLAAFSGLPVGAATLSLAGPCPPFPGRPRFAQELRAAAEATPGVRWLGAQPPTAMGALLAEHDLLVLPSTWPENSPLVVREATAAGLRLILPSLGGARELAPEAPTLPPDAPPAALQRLLEAELQRGRGRLPPRSWSLPDAHARWLVSEVYAPDSGAGGRPPE